MVDGQKFGVVGQFISVVNSLEEFHDFALEYLGQFVDVLWFDSDFDAVLCYHAEIIAQFAARE